MTPRLFLITLLFCTPTYAETIYIQVSDQLHVELGESITYQLSVASKLLPGRTRTKLFVNHEVADEKVMKFGERFNLYYTSDQVKMIAQCYLNHGDTHTSEPKFVDRRVYASLYERKKLPPMICRISVDGQPLESLALNKLIQLDPKP